MNLRIKIYNEFRVVSLNTERFKVFLKVKNTEKKKKQKIKDIL